MRIHSSSVITASITTQLRILVLLLVMTDLVKCDCTPPLKSDSFHPVKPKTIITQDMLNRTEKSSLAPLKKGST